ncbi:MAG: hypothetical protein ACI9MC_004232 [Kiritimatiellia bacterium]|jgi:hypothetical protein
MRRIKLIIAIVGIVIAAGASGKAQEGSATT